MSWQSLVAFGAIGWAGSLAAYGVYRVVRRLRAKPRPALPPVSPLPSAPPGAVTAYEMGQEQLREQLRSLTDIDNKLGVAIGVLGAIAGGFVAAPLPVVLRGLGGTMIGLALFQAIRAFYFGRYWYAPEHAGPLAHASETPDALKWSAFLAIGRAIEVNEVKLFQKGRLLNQVVVTIGLLGGMVLVARTLGLV